MTETEKQRSDVSTLAAAALPATILVVDDDLDVVMSGLCGPKLAEELTAALPGLAVLFTSGHPSAAMSRLGIDLGSDHFLKKPCPPQQLKRKLEEMLATG